MLRIPSDLVTLKKKHSPSEDDILAPLLLHLPVLGALGLDKVLAVGPHCLQPYEGGHKVLGHPVIRTLVSTSAPAQR